MFLNSFPVDKYGNTALTECVYSAAAILVVVPPWSLERGKGGEGIATFSDSDVASSPGKRSDADSE